METRIRSTLSVAEMQATLLGKGFVLPKLRPAFVRQRLAVVHPLHESVEPRVEHPGQVHVGLLAIPVIHRLQGRYDPRNDRCSRG